MNDTVRHRAATRCHRVLVAAWVAGAVLAACSRAPVASAPSGPPGALPPALATAPGPAQRSVEPTVAPASLAAQSSAPPDATLTVDGGDPRLGQLGSYTWRGAGSDSPWLPGTPVSVGAGEPLTVEVGDDVAAAEWSARRAPARTTDGTGAIGLGSGGPGPIAFAAPGPGRWSVQLTVRFAGGLGDAAYYWELDVS